jgi:serine/threonine-protein kinase HipA
MADISILSVKLHGTEIGTITYVGGEKTLLAWNEAYINDANRPTLSLGFKDQFGDLLQDFRPYKIRLMPFFSNLLPEGHMRQYLAQRAGVHAEREYFLLWALGQDLAGAITVVPLGLKDWPNEAITSPEGSVSQQVGDNALRFSLAGVCNSNSLRCSSQAAGSRSQSPALAAIIS